MKFILEDFDFENFLIPIRIQWDGWYDVLEYCFEDFVEFKVYINELKNPRLIEEYMLVNKKCEKYQEQKYWDYATKKLIEKDETGKWIYYAGIYWPHDKVDYKKLSKTLCKINNKEYIEEAKMHWFEFYDCKTGEPIK